MNKSFSQCSLKYWSPHYILADIKLSPKGGFAHPRVSGGNEHQSTKGNIDPSTLNCTKETRYKSKTNLLPSNKSQNVSSEILSGTQIGYGPLLPLRNMVNI